MEQKEGGLRFAVEISFLLLIFSLGFMQPNIEVRGTAVPVTDLLFLVTGFLWFLALLLKKIEFRFDKFYFLLGLYAVGLLLSASLSENPQFSFFKYLGELYLIGLAVMTLNLVRTPEMFKKVVIVWIAASLVTSVAGVLGVTFFYLGLSNFITDFCLHHYGSLPPGNYPRIQGTFVYPSMLCNYLTVSLMMLFAARRLGWVDRRLFAILFVLFTITIAFTVTPGIGGALLAIVLWHWISGRERKRTITPKLILSGGIFAALSFLLVSTFSLIPAPTSPYYFVLGGLRIDPTQRLLAWQGAFQTFIEYPFLGRGIGLGVAEVVFMPPSGRIQLITDAHNIFLSTAGQAGIAGLIPLILIMIVVALRSRPFSVGGGEASPLRLGLGIAFISAFIYQGLVGSFEDARHLWVLMGLIFAIPKSVDLGSSGQ
jgi:putative inorganic carbon (hco3(-)) transporter